MQIIAHYERKIEVKIFLCHNYIDNTNKMYKFAHRNQK